ncbi:unnamed protein product [Echinostoma caproni]|uniref:CKAP2_C domain-containing protein n=1 Tax=Echinostoma caproni TaxID=27848 RepID=A0A183ADL7_9TREM|nr:unnamed protein product [Echinostoma caproni]
MPPEVEELERAVTETSATGSEGPVTPKRAFCLLFHCYQRQGGSVIQFIRDLRTMNRSSSPLLDHAGSTLEALVNSTDSPKSTHLSPGFHFDCDFRPDKNPQYKLCRGLYKSRRSKVTSASDSCQNSDLTPKKTLMNTVEEHELYSSGHQWLNEARRRRTSAPVSGIHSSSNSHDLRPRFELATPLKRARHEEHSPTESSLRSTKKARLSEPQTEHVRRLQSSTSMKKGKLRSKIKRARCVDTVQSVKQSLLPDLWHPRLIDQKLSPSLLLASVESKLEETRRQTLEFRRNLDELRKKLDRNPVKSVGASACDSLQTDKPNQPSTSVTTQFTSQHTPLSDRKLWHLTSLFDQPEAPTWKAMLAICGLDRTPDSTSSIHDQLMTQIEQLAHSDSRVSIYLILLSWLEHCSNGKICEKQPTWETLLDLFRKNGYKKFANHCATRVDSIKPW